MAAAASVGRDRASGQVSLFDSLETAPVRAKPKTGASSVTPWSPEEKLAAEKELLGFYVTGHPLDRYRSLFTSGKYVQISQLAEQIEVGQKNATVTMAGALISVDKKFSKKSGKPFAIVVLEDLSDSIEVGVFGDAFSSGSAFIETGKLVTITARVELRDEEQVRAVATEVKALKRPSDAANAVHLTLDWNETSESDLLEIRDALLSSAGMRPVVLGFNREDGRRIRLHPAEQFRVTWNPELEGRLERWLPKK
jgi:DNA polymerase-3 subunit alpha